MKLELAGDEQSRPPYWVPTHRQPYESGKLWCEEDGVRYYLYVDSAKRLAVTTDASSGATWKVSGSRLSTSVKTSSWFGRTTTYYLGVSGSKFAATTSKSTAVFYEVNN